MYWTVKYYDAKKKKHKIFFKSDITDYDEANRQKEFVIPEPYIRAKLLGKTSSVPKGFKFIKGGCI